MAELFEDGVEAVGLQPGDAGRAGEGDLGAAGGRREALGAAARAAAVAAVARHSSERFFDGVLRVYRTLTRAAGER